jgi:hypothetical protein
VRWSGSGWTTSGVGRFAGDSGSVTCASKTLGLFAAVWMSTKQASLPDTAGQGSGDGSSSLTWVGPVVAVIVVVVLVAVIVLYVYRRRKTASLKLEALPGSRSGTYSGVGKTPEESAIDRLRRSLASVDPRNAASVQQLFAEAAEEYQTQVREHEGAVETTRQLRHSESVRLGVARSSSIRSTGSAGSGSQYGVGGRPQSTMLENPLFNLVPEDTARYGSAEEKRRAAGEAIRIQQQQRRMMLGDVSASHDYDPVIDVSGEGEGYIGMGMPGSESGGYDEFGQPHGGGTYASMSAIDMFAPAYADGGSAEAPSSTYAAISWAQSGAHDEDV